MFSIPHIIWLIVCILLLVGGVFYLLKYRPKLNKVLTVCFIIAILSELTKIFSEIEMIPDANGYYYPYLGKGHLPFHLCSIQIIFITYVKFAKEGKTRDMILAFMFPTALLGALIAIFVPTIFINGTAEAYEPLAFQYFLYHVMLVLLGIYIPLSKQVNITAKHYISTISILGVLGFVSIYINAGLSTVNYETMIYEDVINFFFTYSFAIKLPVTELWHWYLYLIGLLVLVVVAIGLCYTPYFIKERKEKIGCKE